MFNYYLSCLTINTKLKGIQRKVSMEAKLAICGFLIHVLILLGASVNGSTEMNTHEEMRIEQIHSHSSSHMHHMDPLLVVFFFIEDLKIGNTIPIYFPRREQSSSPRLLSKEEADSIPFSSENFNNLLQIFSFLEGSSQALAMEDTLKQCEMKPIKDETKICVTSTESMVDFTQMIFGSQTQTQVLSTTHLTQINTVLQKYKVMGFREIPSPKLVACHTMPYPYAVLYCHYQDSESKVFKVTLYGENGDKVEALAVCHMDTSLWSKNHVAFQALGIEPGSSPVCHFFPSDNFVIVPSSTA